MSSKTKPTPVTSCVWLRSAAMDDQVSVPLGRPTKTPTHTLIRVRDNQRRHRQRRKEYIALLERKLQTAQEEASRLQAENDALRGRLSLEPSWDVTPSVPALEAIPEAAMTSHLAPMTTRAPDHMWPEPSPARVTALGSDSIITAPKFQPGLTSQQARRESAEGTVVNYRPGNLFSPDMSVSPGLGFLLPTPSPNQPPTSTCRPACCSNQCPAPNSSNSDLVWPSSPLSLYFSYVSKSSTTLCSQAYLMIHHQNRRGLSIELVESWLWPGFINSDDAVESGCRVDNWMLLRLLEYIAEDGGIETEWSEL